MNIEVYTYFEALALDRNVTRTAKKLGLTQQALSAQMNRLEYYYGVKLFNREDRFALTYAGERLLEYCRRLDVWSDQVSSEMKDISLGGQGGITIGATAKRGYTILPAIFKTFHAEMPNVRVDVREGRREKLIQELLDQQIDFCYLVSESDNPRIATIPILEERLQLFVKDDVLRQSCGEYYDEIIKHKGQELPIRYFANCPFLLQGGSNRVRNACNRLFEKNDIIPNIIFTSTNSMNLLELARQGFGGAFLVASTRTDAADGFHRLLIQDLSRIEYLKINYLQNRYLSRAAMRFIELSREILPRYLDENRDLAGLL